MAYIGKQPTIGNFVKLDAITTSATDTFNLTNGTVAYYPQSANHCLVSLNGVIQEPTSSGNVGGFTISGSTIVFTSALTATDVIDFILVLGDVLNIGTPSDATVGFSKVTSNLITGATAETSIAGGDSILIYDDSATALRKMTRTNFVAGIGGTNTPNFYAYKSSDQSLTSGTTTKISFQTESYDTDSSYDNSTDYRFTVPSGKNGKYLFNATVGLNSPTEQASYMNINLYKNGSSIAKNELANSLNDLANTHIGLTFIDNASVSDYYEIYATLGGAGGSYVAKATTSYFQGFKLVE